MGARAALKKLSKRTPPYPLSYVSYTCRISMQLQGVLISREVYATIRKSQAAKINVISWYEASEGLGNVSNGEYVSSIKDAVSSSRNYFHIHGGLSVLLWGEVVSFAILGPQTRHQELIRGIERDRKTQVILDCMITLLNSRCSLSRRLWLACFLSLWLGKSVGEWSQWLSWASKDQWPLWVWIGMNYLNPAGVTAGHSPSVVLDRLCPRFFSFYSRSVIGTMALTVG